MFLPPSPAAAPHRARILLVEDDDELRALMAESLSAAGYEIVEARDGEGFIDRLAEALPIDEQGWRFDAIISDIQMPVFNALDVLVGAHRLIGPTPVVLITAFGDPRTHESALLRGAAVVLDKPFRMAVLLETVANLRLLAQAGPPATPAEL
jgi:CheY-like chemotaxis protein